VAIVLGVLPVPATSVVPGPLISVESLAALDPNSSLEFAPTLIVPKLYTLENGLTVETSENVPPVIASVAAGSTSRKSRVSFRSLVTV
jgi:hypothetical protein